MASPFPGMDPYLEDPAFWRDFHHRFIDCWCESVAKALPSHYDARVDESVNLVQMSPDVIKLIYPDIAVSRGPKRTKKKSSTTGTLLLEPVHIPHEFLDEVRQARIEILHRPDRSLVGVLEMLSPFNKSGEGLNAYRAKRITVLCQKVHLVELDLLLGGTRVPLSEPLPRADYYAFLSRADDRPNCEVYGWNLRDPLPTIPIPLRSPDADIHIDLSKVFRATYKRGLYARSLFYSQPPSVEMSSDDKAWAQNLASKRVR